MSGEERTVLFQLPTMISGQLVCTQGTLAGRSWSLSAGTFVIGRAAGSDLTLASEPGVSKLHAKIIAEGDHYSLVDNESRNGTIVNGRPIQKARLKTGDQIRICNCVLRFTQTGGGLPLSADGPAVSDEAPAFDVGGSTSPEVAELTAAGGPPSMEPPPPSAPDLPLPPVTPPTPAPPQPASEYSAVSVELPRPAPEVRVQSAAPWFVAGLAIMVVVLGGGWAGLRLFDDALLGPMPATAKELPTDPIERERLAEAAREQQAAAADAKQPGPDEAKPDEVAAAGDDAKADEPDDEETVDEPAVAAAEDPARASGQEVVASVDDNEPADDDAEAEPDVKLAAAADEPAATDERTAKSAPPVEPAPDETSAPATWYAVSVERDGPIAVKARGGGTVASVAASDGKSVRRGELLFSFEDTGSDEVSNLRANIEALEAVAESQPSAQEMLDREKAKLKRLLAKSGDTNVSAPVSGTLTGFAVKAGDKVTAGATVGVIERSGVTLVVNVSASDGRRIKKGAAVELKTRSGTASGRVTSVRKRGAGYQVTLATDAPSSDVTEAKF